MKRKILIFLMLITILITGCNKKDDSLKDIIKKYDNLKSYTLTGDLEIINNDDTYNYEVKVIYQTKDKFYVSLKNINNSHEQIILKNDEGVYVITPSLNKSFKFQSDWPYNNSQVYLIQSIINDIKKDNEKSIIKDNSNITITTNVNYPNNNKLSKQVVIFDKDYNLKNVSVVDDNGIKQMNMVFKTIDLKPTGINNDTFNINKIIDTNTSPQEEQQTSTLDDIIYPLYIPTGTVLTNSEKINKTNGERVIMTFEGEKPFLLVEETADIEEEFAIIPTYGEPYLLIDTVGALTESSISWNSNGVDYYLVSDVMSSNELIDIARSVNAIPVMK